MLKVIPLGGLGEIGLNMMVIEYDQYILVVDAGLMFPEDYMPGINLVIPDFQYLKDNKDKVKAVILTHGHEDHIGAMPFFLKEFSVPVYGTGFTLELLREKLKEYQLPEQADLRRIMAGDTTLFGPFSVEYISVNHSIVDGVGLAIDTPEGILVHSGDFRIDSTPVDTQLTDLIRFAHYGEKGVLAFFSDSTNAEKEGFTLSERAVKKTLEDLFQVCKGRIIVASFASNISRIQQVIDLAEKYNRKVVLNGKSVITNVNIARQEGFIRLPEDIEISIRQLNQYPDESITVVTTGSQGEPMSSLARMARGQHKGIKIRRNDTIILSSRFIPGNEKTITSIINSLYRMGADVVYEKVSDIHTSGHAKREELKLMLRLVRPRFFIPIHGEYRHLVKHSQLALDMGMSEDNVLIAQDGDVIFFENQSVLLESPVHTGRTIVDGKGIADEGDMVLKDRRKLSGHGVVIVLVVVDEETGFIVYGPDIIPRGVVFEGQAELSLEDAKSVVLEAFEEFERSTPIEWTEVESDIRRRLKRFLYNAIEKNPLILPIIIAV
ncbi:Ribonuclease J 1 [uncultured Desulfobacterium sp.]|uniref:Ribonuclease J n=1 Tax=uncultured Desulfobacterium sp. TaxID=201089 RepID=A0A445MZF5_9BACT|nr:Ribonuclease J 1 [uncultured Desulfobacterium sp.]